jgi:hypothetical protein
MTQVQEESRSSVADPESGAFFLDPWIRDGEKYGSEMNFLDHFSVSLETVFRVKKP